VKTLGATLGAPTVVEVGVDPEKKAEYMKLQKEISEIVKNIRSIQPILASFTEKKNRGVRFTPDQLNYIRNSAATMETQKKSLAEKNARMQELQMEFNPQEKAAVIVKGEVYPGTTIIIGDSSMQVKNTYQYCRFERIAFTLSSAAFTALSTLETVSLILACLLFSISYKNIASS
jgi:uncharacterized protein